MSRPIALVTGASSGIGAAVSALLAHAGYDLVLVARRENRLAALKQEFEGIGANSETLSLDLSERTGLTDATRRAGVGDIDVIVSNAGVSAYGPFAEIDPADLDRAWRLNSDATPMLARAALPGMLERGKGGIIAIASNLAFSAGIPTVPADQGRALPHRALYVGAKAGMVAFTRVLASELDGTGVQATVVCPGLVSSEWNGGASQGPQAMTPENVALAAWSSFTKGETLCLPGLEQVDLLDQLAETERRILGGNIGSDLATRYLP
ncbi:SDR family NAD(P)-dependent oxidoreductase [Arthrobacter sp. AK01]|uniref:SDR family NAD(P)-dependent oxidoreductase n=1 Tax=Arthrobacter sp. AK01 TaxID=2894084 RepID=UPI001E386E03|nr:SDR family NAD(P)-dependent oxidoreductase [Arthrobacter sp. AK01]MCD4851098.1 SDR family NAD(P)-dependent oxidoreductase [Arthrobacter sp. AK01]